MSSNEATKHAMLTGFYHLPHELRNEVYHYLWMDTPATDLIWGGGNKLFALYTVNPSKEHALEEFHKDTHPALSIGNYAVGLPLWLRSSKTIMIEGLEKFNSVGKLFFNTTAFYKPDCSAKYLSQQRFFSPFLALYNCRRLTVVFGPRVSPPSFDTSGLFSMSKNRAYFLRRLSARAGEKTKT